MRATAPLEIRTFVAPGFGENAYVVRCRHTGEAVAIDPGGEAARMADWIESSGARLAAVVLTHAHYDHIEGVGRLVARVPAPIHLHPADAPLYEGAAEQGAMFGLPPIDVPRVDHDLEPGGALQVGRCTLEVRHAPGHSPGHVILYAEDAGVAFVGDVVFQGSIGRSDLPGGDFHRLIRSIREQVLTLPDETVLYPGHGPETTVGHERNTNPFLVPHYGGGLA